MVVDVGCKDVRELGSSDGLMTSMAVDQGVGFRNPERCPSPARTIRKDGGVASEGCLVRGGCPILFDFDSKTRDHPPRRYQITW